MSLMVLMEVHITLVAEEDRKAEQKVLVDKHREDISIMVVGVAVAIVVVILYLC